MGTERSLATLLRSLQTATSPQDALNLLPSALGHLTLLANPLNVTLLSTQLLCSESLWGLAPLDLHSCRRILSVFNTAAITIVNHESAYDPHSPNLQRRGLEREDWLKAVVNGADEKSPRWRHLLLLGGLLLGFEGQNRRSLPYSLRKKLEAALVTGIQLSLDELASTPTIAAYTIVLVLNYTFELLSDWERSRINYDILLPIIADAAFLSPEGLESGYFLGSIDRGIMEIPGQGKFGWPENSPSYHQAKAILARPLVGSFGPLSRLIAHAIENTNNRGQVIQVLDSLFELSRTLMVQWRQNKLSEIDQSEESEFLDAASIQTTVPTLWKLLNIPLFSFIIVLRAILGRVLNDPILASDRSSPFIASKSLKSLRHLAFITSRTGYSSSSQYVFVNLTAIDILAQYPNLSEDFLEEIRPSDSSKIPPHPLDRCLDLFFLNTAEHFSLIVSPILNERLLLSAAQPYLAAGGNNHLLEIFESAHSVVLAVLAAPQSADMAAKHLPSYVNTLFTVFPQNLSARQFRLAFKTILKITAPPSPLANSQPYLPSVLLQLLYDRAIDAPTTPLLPPATDSTPNPASEDLSEQGVLTMSIIDGLPFLRVELLEDWLDLTVDIINRIPDKDMRRKCQEKFWDTLSNGDMDVERANFCVTWWSTRSGRDMLLQKSEEEDAQMLSMSGGLLSQPLQIIFDS
ncbi:peroxin 8 [Microsporum canis CBS 113480]|uniref:Peroxin 8 n=1 Tax=Arthroderma otae (strain ATCC MYA-4605 / CBS 113480) TaxID=554155 RepID=C5FNH5_ARTOC|nr:peroxin 8 [Microsporum canis CBS 113480]EEQ31589.1 peroxin 8 [Microsporum canis CBS 113480]